MTHSPKENATVHSLIETIDLEKSYPEGFRLGPLSLTVDAGETVAILGRNGAGKSTLFQLLTANLDASRGTVSLNGKRFTPDRADLKRQVGYLPQNLYLPRWATGHEILAYAARLYELDDAKAQVLRAEDYWDCASFRDKPLASLSYGMQKRVALALATLSDPPLLILDEPWSGLDVYQVRALDIEIERRASAGHATIVSTHVAAYVARLCDRAYVIEGGQMELLESFASRDFLGRIELIEGRFFDKPEYALKSETWRRASPSHSTTPETPQS